MRKDNKMDDSTVPRQRMRETFADPGSEFRPAPFWSWNSIMDEDEVRRQVADFAEHGFGGAFAHARQGLVTAYLSEDFFRAWAAALDESKKNGVSLCVLRFYSYLCSRFSKRYSRTCKTLGTLLS